MALSVEAKSRVDTAIAALKAFVARRTDPIAARLSAVEVRLGAVSMLLAKTDTERGVISELETLIDRVRALEDRPVPKYLGVWEAGRGYSELNFVTHAGSVWHCNAPTTSRPGDDKAWTLAVKKGRDAK